MDEDKIGCLVLQANNDMLVFLHRNSLRYIWSILNKQQPMALIITIGDMNMTIGAGKVTRHNS